MTQPIETPVHDDVLIGFCASRLEQAGYQVHQRRLPWSDGAPLLSVIVCSLDPRLAWAKKSDPVPLGFKYRLHEYATGYVTLYSGTGEDDLHDFTEQLVGLADGSKRPTDFIGMRAFPEWDPYLLARDERSTVDSMFEMLRELETQPLPAKRPLVTLMPEPDNLKARFEGLQILQVA